MNKYIKKNKSKKQKIGIVFDEKEREDFLKNKF